MTALFFIASESQNQVLGHVFEFQLIFSFSFFLSHIFLLVNLTYALISNIQEIRIKANFVWSDATF